MVWIQFKREWNDFVRTATKQTNIDELFNTINTHPSLNKKYDSTANNSFSNNNSNNHNKTFGFPFGYTYGRIVSIFVYNHWSTTFFLPLSALMIGTIHMLSILSRYIYNRKWEYIYFTMITYLLVLGNTMFIYGISDLYIGRTQPPKWYRCYIQTKANAISLLLLSICMTIPSILVMEGVFIFIDLLEEGIIYAGDFFINILGGTTEYMIFALILYYTTLFLIIVVPVVLFEQPVTKSTNLNNNTNININSTTGTRTNNSNTTIINPILAMKRSYQLTANYRIQLFVLVLFFATTWACAEMMMDSIRSSIVGSPMSWKHSHHHHNQKGLTSKTTATMMSIINETFLWIPTIIFLPLLSILQTVVYINVSNVREIRNTNNVLPSSSLSLS